MDEKENWTENLFPVAALLIKLNMFQFKTKKGPEFCNMLQESLMEHWLEPKNVVSLERNIHL